MGRSWPGGWRPARWRGGTCQRAVIKVQEPAFGAWSLAPEQGQGNHGSRLVAVPRRANDFEQEIDDGAILEGEVEDTLGLWWKLAGMEWAGLLGLVLLWIAAILTAITGFDYLMKAMPHLKEKR